MHQYELEEFGKYEPGFLYLRMETEKDVFQLNELVNNPDTSRLFSTYLHEYIHFLQEISTTFGLSRGFHYIEWLKGVIVPILESKDESFDVPVQIDNKFNVQSNMKLHAIYLGQGFGKEATNSVKYTHYYDEDENCTDKDGNNYRVKKYVVNYLDWESRRQEKLYFGATCLKEYVAHTIQKSYCPGVEHPDVPYNIAELIVEKEYPILINNIMNVVALCDASLMALHPAQIFFNTLERMKEQNFVPRSYKEVYEFTFADVKLVGMGGEHSIDESLKMIAGLSVSQYESVLKSEIFAPARDWLTYLINQATVLRLAIPDFMLYLVDGECKMSEDFKFISKGLGSPFITNKSEKGAFIPPEPLQALSIQPYQLFVFKQIIRVFSGHKDCGLYNFCKTSPNGQIINEKCLTAPWEKSTEEQLCPFAQFWVSWGLKGKKPKFKTQ